MSTRPGYAKRLIEVEKSQISEKIDFAEIVRRQVDRCLQSIGDEVAFATNVIGLECLISDEELTDEYLEEREKYTETVEYSTPTYNCGIPVVDDILPGRKEITEETNWFGRFNACINLLAVMGVRWKKVESAVL